MAWTLGTEAPRIALLKYTLRGDQVTVFGDHRTLLRPTEWSLARTAALSDQPVLRIVCIREKRCQRRAPEKGHVAAKRCGART
ncbi:MAG: hypothetical protein AAF989_14660, partial [Planctomycetota bacterium]